MPLGRNNRSITRLKLVVQLTTLPVPEAEPSSAVTGHEELTVGGDIDVDSVTGIVVSSERLLPVLPELIGSGVDDDLVVTALVGDVFPARMWRRTDHAVHVWFCDELDGYRYAVFPCAQGFVVGCGDEPAVLVDEGDGVYGTEMVVVFLDHLFGAGVELYDFLVRHTGEELVGLRWVEADYVWDLASREAVEAFAGFGVPELHVPVVGG